MSWIGRGAALVPRAPVALVTLLALAAAPAAARADAPALLPDRLGAAPCMPTVASGADLRCGLDARGRPLPAPSPLWPAPETYFARHSARVEHDLLLFGGDYTLAQMRARDRLRLFGGPGGGPRAALLGFSLFSAAMVAAAHAPRALRPLFDGSLHLGPAVFDSGMGAGFGGSL